MRLVNRTFSVRVLDKMYFRTRWKTCAHPGRRSFFSLNKFNRETHDARMICDDDDDDDVISLLQLLLKIREDSHGIIHSLLFLFLFLFLFSFSAGRKMRRYHMQCQAMPCLGRK
jgi:hypothetical protein